MNAKRILPCMLITACFAGTAFAGGPDVPPPAKIARPWTQVRQAQAIPVNAHVSIQVTGKTAPMLGDETLLQGALSARLASLLERRGFVVVTENPDFLVQLTYDVTRRDAALSSGGSDERGSAWAGASLDGLGVEAARLEEVVSFAAMIPGQSETPVAVQYLHAASVEFFDPRGTLVWKGDCRWDSKSADPERRIVSPLAMLLSGLPTSGDVTPKVKKVRDNGAAAFWELNINSAWIACPALPHQVFTRRELTSKEPGAMLAAVADLLQTAEYAVPDGKEDLDAPLDPANWEKVVIGGEYLVGEDPAPQKILAWLEASPSGYSLDRFRVVTPAEYAKYTLRLTAWKKALGDKLPAYAQ